MKNLNIIFISFVFIFVGIGAYLVVSKDTDSSNSVAESSDEYPYLAKRIFVENPNDPIINFSPLRTSLNQYFADNNLKGSLYFEYLPTGTSIRIRGSDEYRAASLMKLPVAMELYKAAELGLIELDDSITLKQEWLNDGFGDLYQRGAGYELSLRDAVKILLQDSDNTALRAIIESTSGLEIKDRALGALDVEFSQTNEGEISIGSRSYSSFLKCLYFACYINKDNSQELLRYLADSEFDTRLVAGVPDNIVVAHKIGVFDNQVQGDCGIVYLENKNYILCMMIQGLKTESTDKYFEDVSNTVYKFLDQQ